MQQLSDQAAAYVRLVMRRTLMRSPWFTVGSRSSVRMRITVHDFPAAAGVGKTNGQDVRNPSQLSSG